MVLSHITSFIKRFIVISIFVISLQAQKSFVFVTASYNNEQWLEKNLISMFTQKYPRSHWRLIYIDDCSTDKTRSRVRELIDRYNMWDQVTLIENDQRRGHLANQYDAIHSCLDDEIVVNVDGDDWLPHEHVLTKLNQVYADLNVWMTYGQYKALVGGSCTGPIPAKVVLNNTIRTYTWRLSHPRTFYVWLFKKIKKADLMHDGKFFPNAADRATMIPMFEMAAGRYKYIDNEILYIYNNQNPLACDRIHKNLSIALKIIRERAPYKPL